MAADLTVFLCMLVLMAGMVTAASFEHPSQGTQS
jgi:hypothetical protein